MKCPFCHHEETKVTDSRAVSEINIIRRRRECLECQKRFTTFESVDLTVQVQKRDGTYEDFQIEKLTKGLEAACRHSKISHDQVKEIITQITSELMSKQLREVSSKDLGEKVMNALEKIDVVAYIRFACVYKRYKDIHQVMQAIESIVLKREEIKEDYKL